MRPPQLRKACFPYNVLATRHPIQGLHNRAQRGGHRTVPHSKYIHQHRKEIHNERLLTDKRRVMLFTILFGLFSTSSSGFPPPSAFPPAPGITVPTGPSGLALRSPNCHSSLGSPPFGAGARDSSPPFFSKKRKFDGIRSNDGSGGRL